VKLHTQPTLSLCLPNCFNKLILKTKVLGNDQGAPGLNAPLQEAKRPQQAQQQQLVSRWNFRYQTGPAKILFLLRKPGWSRRRTSFRPKLFWQH
jgi:hypothetical protein